MEETGQGWLILRLDALHRRVGVAVWPLADVLIIPTATTGLSRILNPMNEPFTYAEKPGGTTRGLHVYLPDANGASPRLIPLPEWPRDLNEMDGAAAGQDLAQALPAFDPEDDSQVSALDELSLWAAPFGLKLLETVRLGRGLRVLDVGSGLGFPMLELAMRLDAESEVHGLDPWVAGHRRNLFKARQAGLGNVFLHKGYAEQMPFPDGCFDRVVSNNGFNNTVDMELAFAEAARVCKLGAQLVFTMNLGGSFQEVHQVLRPLLEQSGLPGSAAALEVMIEKRRKPLAETLELARLAGFRVEQAAHDQFAYRFADGAAMLRHAFFRNFQVPHWRELVPAARRDALFAELEARLNHQARELGELRLSVPFVTVSAVCEG